MILHDADKIIIGGVEADRVYFRGDLIWPLTRPASLTGIRLIDGTVLTPFQSSTISIWEHNCSIPIWLETTEELSNPILSITGRDAGTFSIEHYEGNLYILKDIDSYNNNASRSAVLNISADNLSETYSISLIKLLEYQGTHFLYNDKACVHAVETISPDGVDVQREFYMAEVWYGSDWTASYQPVVNEGNVSKGYLLNGNFPKLGTSAFGSYRVTDGYDRIYNDDNALSIYDSWSDFTNFIVKYRISENTSGRTRYFLIRIITHEDASARFNSDAYLFLIQPSK